MEMKKPSEFLNYINKPLTKDNISTLYITNNVIFERTQLYQDFILSLVDLVCETYLGDDITDDDEKFNHFDWCWNKTLDNFKNEGIDFSNNKELYEYFLNFMLETFYISSIKDNNLHFRLLKLWSYLFGFKTEKTRADIDSFIEVYQLFDNSIKKSKKNVV